MTRVDANAPPREAAPPELRPLDSATERMQQRLEWERAFLDAQPPRTSPGPEPSEAPAAQATTDPGRHTSPQRVATPAESTANPSAGAEPSQGGTRPVAPADSPPLDQHRPAARVPRSTSAGPERPAPTARQTPQPRASAPAARSRAGVPTESPASKPDSVAMGVFRDETSVRMWLRDASVDRPGANRLVQFLRRTLAKLGLRLSSFTVNGDRLVDEPGPDAIATRNGTRDPERDLDIIC